MFPGKHPFRFLWVRSAGLERGDGVGEPVALEFLDAALVGERGELRVDGIWVSSGMPCFFAASALLPSPKR